MTKYAITYTELTIAEKGIGSTWTETADDLAYWWDAERAGEIFITHIDATTDDWETSFEVFDQKD